MHLLNIVLFWVFFGFLCSYLARKRSRNPILWFWLGIGLGLIAVLVLLFLPKKRAPSAPPHVRAQMREAPQPPPSQEGWYYLGGDRKHVGPFSVADLQTAWRTHSFSELTFFWKEGMENWARLRDLPHLQQEINTIEV